MPWGTRVVFFLALLALAGCERGSGASGRGGGAPSASAPPALVNPGDLTPLAEVVKQAPGSRVKTRAFVWLFRPTCKPCAPGAHCEPCPPALFQFSEKPNTGAGSAPGALILSDFNGGEPKLDTKTEYVLEGALEQHPEAKGQPFIRIEKIGTLTAAP